MAVAILRTEKGLDYSNILSDDKDKPTSVEEPRSIQPNDSTTDLLANSHVHGSNDSLSRNGSEGIQFILQIFRLQQKNTLFLINY